LMPPSYPRILEEAHELSLTIVAAVFGGLSLTVVLLTGYAVHRRREKRSIRVAQIEFIWMILAGALILTVGAVVVGSPPSDSSCVASIWCVNIGFCLLLVPLITKVAAINRLMLAAGRMRRRVILKRRSLFGLVALVTLGVTVYLIIWTVLDPPHTMIQYEVTDEVAAGNETVVGYSYYCSSDSPVWAYSSIGWHGILLFAASVLAFQTRNMKQEFNEAQLLAKLIYSLFVFALLLVVSFILSGSHIVGESSLALFRSILYSLSTISATLIYFLPKLLVSFEQRSIFGAFPTSSDDGFHRNQNFLSNAMGLMISNISSLSTTARGVSTVTDVAVVRQVHSEQSRQDHEESSASADEVSDDDKDKASSNLEQNHPKDSIVLSTRPLADADIEGHSPITQCDPSAATTLKE